MHSLENLLITPNSPAINALKLLDSSAAQIVFVVNDDRVLIGCLTDGDIRRGLLCGRTLSEKVSHFMNTDFLSITSDVSKVKAIDLMKSKQIHQLPVLNNDGIIIDYHLLKEYLDLANLPNSVVIMAGGKGTRLRPLTETCPKPMLPINGKPILEIILNRCIESGFTKFYFSVNFLKSQIIDYFGDGSNWNISISYLEEYAPLGTAGSLKLMPPQKHPFLVMNGDVLTNLDYRRLLDFHHDQQSSATLCVRDHHIQIPYGVVKTKSTLLSSFQEKPTFIFHINAGIYVLNNSCIDLIENNSLLDMTSLLEYLNHQSKRVSVFPIHEYWLDVGQIDTYNKAHDEWVH